MANIDGDAAEEAVAGTASLDLAALEGNGTPTSDAWPKLTSDWIVANPLIGTFGTHDTDAGVRKAVVAQTRSGTIFAYATGAPACSPGSWPRFHHDNANSGDYRRDAVLPGKPEELRSEGRNLLFKAPGDDLLCGRAARYEILTGGEIPGATPSSAASAGSDRSGGSEARAAQTLSTEPGEPGSAQSVQGPPGVSGRVGIRAVDEQGNVGPTAVTTARGGDGNGDGDGDGDGDGGGDGGGSAPGGTGSGAGVGTQDGDADARGVSGAAEGAEAADDGADLPFTGLALAALLIAGAILFGAGSLLWRRMRAGSEDDADASGG